MYDHDTGQLIRVSSRKPVYVYYKPRQRRSKQPYGLVKVEGRKLAVHRVVWAVVYGSWPEGIVDHINRDTTDNRIENLRIVDPTGNSRNRSRSSDNTSGHNGIDFSSGKWRVRVGTVFGGRYDNLDLAIKVRDLLYTELGYSEGHGS